MIFFPLEIYSGEFWLLLNAIYINEHKNKNVPTLISTIITLFELIRALHVGSGALDRLENVKYVT